MAVTIAIFPFENLTVGDGLDIFCHSFSLDLVTEMSKFRQFQIIGLQSAREFSAGNDQIERGVNKLKTDYHLVGSYRNDSRQIRINAQLFKSDRFELIWANRFEGPLDSLMDIQEDLLKEVVSSLQHQLNLNLLNRIRSKPHVNLKAYEYYLWGMDELKKGSRKNDQAARAFFQKAIEIDPEYSLGYSGMSLSYFNDWSCQIWERWEVSQSGAFEWAEKAIELDEENYVAAFVLGRVFLYEEAFETAEYYLRRSLSLNPHDPDYLVQIASCFVFLGLTEEAWELYQRALRLNPSRSTNYQQVGMLILLESGKMEEALSMARSKPQTPWADYHAMVAGIYFHLGDLDAMNRSWESFLDTYRNTIDPTPEVNVVEALEWIRKINPYKNTTRLQPFWSFMGDSIPQQGERANDEGENKTATKAWIRRKNELWEFGWVGDSCQLPEIKGFFDLEKLLLQPGRAFHCAELMGAGLVSEGVVHLDEKAKRDYMKKLSELQEDMEEAERHQDFESMEKWQIEYDALVEHLSSSLGLQGRTRKSGGSVERARSAVTWRIRHAISKIERVHQRLGRHLSNSVKTGTVCTYQPEVEVNWSSLLD